MNQLPRRYQGHKAGNSRKKKKELKGWQSWPADGVIDVNLVIGLFRLSNRREEDEDQEVEGVKDW